MYIVLMAGGTGTRFWPMSRALFPKQVLNIFGDRTMLQMTYDRVCDLTSDNKILIITNEDLKKQVTDQLPNIPAENIIAEPFGRNTAPCIGLAASIIKKRSTEDEVMMVLPADHLIEDVSKFRETLIIASNYAKKQSCLITIGVKPDYPETGYGYIQQGEEIIKSEGRPIYKVRTFAEKPNPDTAERFLKSGDFLWNSGIFIWSTGKIIHEFEQYQPGMADGFNQLIPKIDTAEMDEAILDVYSKVKSVSIDYAIMELTHDVCIIEADFSWNDVGSWEAAYNISEKDQKGNAIIAKDHCLIRSKNNYFHTSKKLVAAIDVEGLVVVETDDALLICKKEESQNVKDVVDSLRRKKLNEYL